MKKIFIWRLLIYPIISCIIWHKLYVDFEDFFLIETVKGVVLKTIPFDFKEEINFIIFGIAFGYVYGTVSLFIKVRKFKGFIFFALFLFKVLQCIIFANIAIYFYLLEILLLPLILYFIKKRKKIKKIKVENKKKEENKKIKEEILFELREEMLSGKSNDSNI